MSEEEQISEQDLNNAVQTLEMYKAQLDTLAKHRELIETSLNEHKRGLETLKEYSNAKEGTEILVPIGGGTYLPAVVGKKKVMLALGAEYYSEEDFDRAISEFEKRVEELESSLSKVDESIRQINDRATQLSIILSDYYAKHQQ